MHSKVIPTLLFAAIFFGCGKSKEAAKPNPGNPSGPASVSFTSGMAGIRNWHGHHYYYAEGLHWPTAILEDYDYPDTSFALTIVDDSTVNVMGRDFKYDRTDTIDHVYYFGTAYTFFKSPYDSSYSVYGSGQGVAYFYTQDSIAYGEGDIHHTNDFWRLFDLYHTY